MLGGSLPAGGGTSKHLGTAAPVLPGAGPQEGTGLADEATFLDLERQLQRAVTAWNKAADAFDAAEQACWTALDDLDADEAFRQAAITRQMLADDEANRLGQALDDLATKLCAMPAEDLAGLACKARVALTHDMQGLAELVLRDLLRLAERADG